MTNSKEKKATIPEVVSVKRFSEILDLPVTTVMGELMKNGIMATINEEIDFETASIIGEELGYTILEDLEIADNEIITLEKLFEICEKEKTSDKKLVERPPIVTVLGHVDHGKTTLLDAIRKTQVAKGETGGITQHITAYQAKKKGKLITLVDTPGHEAFAAMRERGVSIADIAILVVAADDGVRPQTKEVIKYLLEKSIPTVVAINKIDKPDANVDRVKKELADFNLIIEEWGGDIICNEVSAKNNIGIGKLLESVLLLAEVEEFEADANRDGLAIVLESHKDPQKGPITTALVKTGSLQVGQDITVGNVYGRIRRLEDYNGNSVKKAPPSMPVTIFGLNAPAETNTIIQVANAKRSARLKSKEIAEKMAGNKKNVKSISSNDNIPKLNIIIKSDVQGSIEALEELLSQIPQQKVAINFVNSGVGNITESDVKLAINTDSIIYGFNVSTNAVARRLANDEIEIKNFGVIYEIVDDIKNNLIELLPEEIERTYFGKLEILGVFFTERDKMIVGGKVIDGKIISKDAKIDVYRNDKLIGTGELENLQHNKVNIDEVRKGKECGITFRGNTKIKLGDVFEIYTQAIKEKSLS